MKLLLTFPVIFILAGTGIYGQSKLSSSVYDFDKLPVQKTPYGEERNVLKGPTRSLNMFEIKAITLLSGKASHISGIEDVTDELLIIRDGVARIQINNENRSLGEGSVIVVSSGDDVTITNSGNINLTFYSVTFRPYMTGMQKQTARTLPPILIDWKSLVFKTSANGGRRDIMKQKTSALKELEIHVTTLNEGLPSHSAHVHPDEEIILVRKGFVEETIKGKPSRMGPGSVIFLTDDDLHGISNAGKGQCEYYAIRWLTE